jgi:hypothetical protein
VYSRDYQGRTVNFEASGGLVNASLIMQDQQTDTYWSIMEGEAVAGELSGEKLNELPVGEKMQWRQWKEKHPETLVLSVNGREDAPDGYRDYFRDSKGFGGTSASDDRLRTKEPIFAFHRAGTAFAVRHDDIEKGAVFALDDATWVFLYRGKGESMFASTRAFISTMGFEPREDTWVEIGSRDRFDIETGAFVDVENLGGFDTFWYNFSLNNPETKLLK